jgi:hypothetical protein
MSLNPCDRLWVIAARVANPMSSLASSRLVISGVLSGPRTIG